MSSKTQLKTTQIMRNLNNTGHKFECIGDTDIRGEIVGYGSKAEAIKINKALPLDFNGIRMQDRKNVLFDGVEATSKFTIGFEVEKNTFHRGCVKEYPLFCGFERDGSCGFEAVTHVLPLLGKSYWRTKVFNMFHEAQRVIEDSYSPSDVSCGGHITVGVEGMDGADLMERMRKFVPILYAIFRKRLANTFCYGNPQMVDTRGGVGININVGKYSVALNKHFGVEIRLPSRVTSVKQMIRRYELMYHIVDFAVNHPNATYNRFIRTIEPILLSMYNQDADKVTQLVELSKHFRKFIFTGKVDINTIGWVNGWWRSNFPYSGSNYIPSENYQRSLVSLIQQNGGVADVRDLWYNNVLSSRLDNSVYNPIGGISNF